MAEYIDRDAFLTQERAWYCDNCDRRKNSKGKTVYEIGEAPCRACDIGDVLDALEDYPAADVVERKTGKWILSQDCEYEYCTCSECGYDNGENWMIGSKIPYCEKCGSYNGGDDNGT